MLMNTQHLIGSRYNHSCNGQLIICKHYRIVRYHKWLALDSRQYIDILSIMANSSRIILV